MTVLYIYQTVKVIRVCVVAHELSQAFVVRKQDSVFSRGMALLSIQYQRLGN